MIIYLKNIKGILSIALLAFTAFVILSLVFNDASMKYQRATTIKADLTFHAELLLKRLSEKLSAQAREESCQPAKELSMPFCTWKDSNGTLSDIHVNQTYGAKEFHNFSHAYDEQQYLCLCPQHSPLLRGRSDVYQGDITWDQAQVNKTMLYEGGHYVPLSCQARSRVAILIPYRDREEHLILFLHNIHTILMRQQIVYGIYVIEQAGEMKFNRALLFNVGYVEALKDFPYWDCFIFHDVDHIPEDDRNLYQCAEGPRLMAVAVDKWNYTHPYEGFFGAVTAISSAQFKLLNGYSNQFWGWGGEDDDMHKRIKHAKLNITKCSKDIDRYTTLKHNPEEKSRDRFEVLKQGHLYYERDGLNNIEYKLLGVKKEKLFTHITVEAYKITPGPKKKGE